MELHKDPWMMQRIAQALDAIRYSDQEGLETELDLIAFAEDVLARFAVLVPGDRLCVPGHRERARRMKEMIEAVAILVIGLLTVATVLLVVASALQGAAGTIP